MAMKVVFRTKTSTAAWDRVVRDDVRSPEPATEPTQPEPANENEKGEE